MTRFARIAGGRVAELITLPDGIAIAEAVHPDLAAQFAAVPPDAAPEPGWSYADGAFSPPPAPPLSELQATRTAAARAEFDARVAAGMPWQGRVLQIDDVSRANLSGAALRAERGTLPEPFYWTMADNSDLALDAAGMLAMAEAAMDHYYTLKRHYEGLRAAVAAAPDAEALAAIDLTAGWPEAAG